MDLLTRVRRYEEIFQYLNVDVSERPDAVDANTQRGEDAMNAHTNHPIEDVEEFQNKFNVPMPATPQMLSAAAMRFRTKFIEEEYEELCVAYDQNDMSKMIDALIDLVYVAYGTALMMGVTPATWQKCWDAVHQANMTKRRAASADESKRGSELDVVKPADFIDPVHTIEAIVRELEG